MRGFWDTRKVLITGISGYLGTELCRALLERGSHIVGIDRREAGGIRKAGLSDRVKLLLGDLTDLEFAQKALEEAGINTCFHLAAMSGVKDCQDHPHSAFRTNVYATCVLLEACRVYGRLSEIVVVSSNHIYGEQEVTPTPEEAPFRATGVYGTSKACADLIARCYALTYSLPIGIARITNTFGGDDPHTDHLILGTILSVLRNEPPVIRGDGKAAKGYLYIKDTVSALLTLAESINRLNLRGEAFNFAPDSPISVSHLVQKIVGISGKVHLEPAILGSPQDRAETENLSNEKAKRLLGWQPKYSLEQGLRETFECLSH